MKRLYIFILSFVALTAFASAHTGNGNLNWSGDGGEKSLQLGGDSSGTASMMFAGASESGEDLVTVVTQDGEFTISKASLVRGLNGEKECQLDSIQPIEECLKLLDETYQDTKVIPVEL